MLSGLLGALARAQGDLLGWDAARLVAEREAVEQRLRSDLTFAASS